MRRRTDKQRKKESDRELARRQRVNEEQDTEIEALEAIFAGLLSTDVDTIDIDHDYPRAFSINVVPHPAVPERNHSFLDLVVRLHREYPANAPEFQFRSWKGLTKAELALLMDRINEQAQRMLNEPMIYDIVTTIQEELRLHNNPDASLHEEMVEKHRQEVRENEEFEKERENENLRLQRENETRLAERQATEALTSAAEKQLRKNWLESKAASSSDPAPRSDKDDLRKVQLLLVHLLRLQSKESTLLSLVTSGLIPEPIAKMPFGALVTQVSDLSSRLQLSMPRISPRSSLPSIEKQASALPSEAARSRSRYHTDFIEIELLGKGSFGRVLKVQNRLDGLYYAMKIIEMRMENESDFRRILREVTALSRLSHPYVLRYYQAFIECVDDQLAGRVSAYADFEDGLDPDGTLDNTYDWSLSIHSDSLYNNNNVATNNELGLFPLDLTESATVTSDPNLSSKSSTYELYIQTEFCAQTLRETIASEARRIDPEQNWRRFRQILEGLAHIHSQGICHRDLKLGNIFVHPCGDVRIGDLGLATHFQMAESRQQYRLSPSTSPNELTAEQTTAIGTLLYTAPEIIQTGSTSRYDSKVDMYSLGIVFFEMWYPFGTGHERVQVLQKLRQLANPIFPDGFPESHPRQSQIIRWLLQADPTDRPSALELLQSNLLPPKLEDEYMKDALRTISNPNTPFYHRLLSELFSSVRPMPSEPASVALPSATANVTANPYLAAACRQYVIAAVRAAFESRSGMERSGQILQRSMPPLPTEGQVLLMDREGRLLDLRRDLRSDLIMDAGSGRQFQLGPVFRAPGPGRVQPRHIFQADFDFLGADAKAPYADAEILSLQLALLDMFPILGETRVQIGHRALTAAVLEICHVPDEIQPILLDFAKDVQSGLGSQIDLLRQFLSRYSSRLNVALLTSIVSHRGSPSESIVHLRNHFVHNRDALAALHELQDIASTASLFGVAAHQIEISPLLAVPSGYFSGFISKAFVHSHGVRTCLSVAGRYGAPKSESSVSGVGLSLAIEQLWDMLSVAESQERRPNKTVLSHCTDVFVASIGSKDVFEERLKIVGELYSIGMNVAYLPSKSATLEEQQEAAASRNSQWLLTIKDKYVQNSVRMRQLDSDKKQEFDLPRDEIVKFFSGSKQVPWRKR